MADETNETKGKRSMTLKEAKAWRAVSGILFCLVAYLTPALIIGFKVRLFTEASGMKLTAFGGLLLLAILWRFKNKLIEWISKWEYSVLKYLLLGLSKVWVFILLLLVLILSRNGLETAIFCVEWFCVCECVAYLVVNPFYEKFDYEVKRLIRKAERKDDYKEAIRELEGDDK